MFSKSKVQFQDQQLDDYVLEVIFVEIMFLKNFKLLICLLHFLLIYKNNVEYYRIQY